MIAPIVGIVAAAFMIGLVITIVRSFDVLVGLLFSGLILYLTWNIFGGLGKFVLLKIGVTP